MLFTLHGTVVVSVVTVAAVGVTVVVIMDVVNIVASHTICCSVTHSISTIMSTTTIRIDSVQSPAPSTFTL